MIHVWKIYLYRFQSYSVLFTPTPQLNKNVNIQENWPEKMRTNVNQILLLIHNFIIVFVHLIYIQFILKLQKYFFVFFLCIDQFSGLFHIHLVVFVICIVFAFAIFFAIFVLCQHKTKFMLLNTDFNNHSTLKYFFFLYF